MPRETDRAAFEPALSEGAAAAWLTISAALQELDGDPARIEALAMALPALVEEVPSPARPRLRAAGLVALDLARQGWWFSGLGGLCVAPPDREREAVAEKQRVRAQLHLERDRQLQEPAVREFIRRMETRRPFAGRWVSVFDVMRDGRELAGRLRAARGLRGEARVRALAGAVQPYLQVVDGEARCAHTGLLLREIWRYFRHTWATPYKSVPGRGLMFLVRDASAENHPVIGVTMLTSAPAQISCRDAWIGWHPDTLVERLRAAPTDGHARWLAAELRRALAELYVQDLLEDGLVTPAELRAPRPETLRRLRDEARRARAEHARFARSAEHKREADEIPSDPEGWVRRARLPLFRSKRAALLADLLDARRVIGEALGEAPEARALGTLLAREEGRRALRLVARRAKADRMGVAMRPAAPLRLACAARSRRTTSSSAASWSRCSWRARRYRRPTRPDMTRRPA